MRPFELLRREPSLLIAELTWRWSFALGTAAVLMFVSRRLSHALNLAGIYDIGTIDGSTLARTRVIAQAIVRSLPAIGGTLIAATCAIAVLWVFAATLGRGVVTRAIVREIAADCGRDVSDHFSRLAMAGAHAVRVFTGIILLIGYMMAAMAERRILNTDPAYVADPTSIPAPGTLLGVLLAFSLVMGLTAVLWSLVHFVASIAPIFVARDGRGTLDALVDSVTFVRRRWRTLLSVATQNGTLRTVVALAISAAAVVAGILLIRRSPYLAWTVIALLTFAYCVLSDWFLLARTIAYVQIAEENRAVTESAAVAGPRT